MTETTIDAMIAAALEGGADVMSVYSTEFDVELKDDRSPLTEADRRSHESIDGILRTAAPEVPILSEEGAHADHGERRTWQRYFLIDPLDGTKEFVKRNGEFTVNVALVAADGRGGWAPVAGVVYAPYLEELFVGVTPAAGAGVAAWTGCRYWSGVVAGAPEPPADEATAIPRTPGAGRRYTIVASRSHMSPETEAFVESRRAAHAELDLINAGSSLKLCRVADGTADEYPRFAPTMEWDTAAGDAVARAAGCTVEAWDAASGSTVGPLQYNKKDLHNPWFLVRGPGARGTTA